MNNSHLISCAMRLSGSALLSSIYIKNNTNFFAITMIFPQYILKSIISFDPILFLNLILQQSNACFYHLYSYKRTVETSAIENNHCHIFFHFIYSMLWEVHGATGGGSFSCSKLYRMCSIHPRLPSCWP